MRGVHVSARTVRDRLREFGLNAGRSYAGLPLTPDRRRRRTEWLIAHRPGVFSPRQWREVLFSDESRFLLYRSDRTRVYRRPGERFSDACVVQCDRVGGGGLMVWAGISHGQKPPLIFIEGSLTDVCYRDTVLQPIVVPFVQRHNLTFQHDMLLGYAMPTWPTTTKTLCLGRHSVPIFRPWNIFWTFWTECT